MGSVCFKFPVLFCVSLWKYFAIVEKCRILLGGEVVRYSKVSLACMSAVLFMSAACTTPAPTYKNSMPSADDAEVIFESDFELHTHFKANIDRSESSCGTYQSTGYLLKKDSILIYDKPNLEIKIKVPTKKLIGIAGYHYFSDPTYRSNCYPPDRFFTPEPNETYVVKLNKISADRGGGGYCYLSVESMAANGNRTPVKTIARPACKNAEAVVNN